VDEPSREELEAAHCWERSDRVAGRPEMTAFRRAARLHHARWREARGHPMGSQPIRPAPGRPVRPVGSRLTLAHAQQSGATFLTPAARAAAGDRVAAIEAHQTFDRQRLWAELLWSPTLAFNLFGDLAADLASATRAVRTWWSDVPGTVSAIRFAHSPGRMDPSHLGNLSSFDAAFVLALRDGTQGLLAVACRYHEAAPAEVPKPGNMPRYREVAERSGAFVAGAADHVAERDHTLTVTWLAHLLALSTVQHPSGTWTWTRLVVVHPEANTDAAALSARYQAVLANPGTFASTTLEALLRARALPTAAADELEARYVVT